MKEYSGIYEFPLPNGKTMSVMYNDKVFNPHYSSLRDTIGLADMCISEVKPSRFIDVACGSGVIGLAIKKLHSLLDVTLCDIDKNAVEQAKANAQRLKLKVTVMQADLLPKAVFYPVVAANLPTFDAEQMKSEPLHGPTVAYKGEGKDGLGLYRKLLGSMQAGQFIICEVQEKHQPAFYTLLAELGVFQVIATSKMAFALFRKPDHA